MTQTDAQTLKEEGNKLFKEGSYLKAAAAYTRALKASPDNAVLYRWVLLLPDTFQIYVLNTLLQLHADTCACVRLSDAFPLSRPHPPRVLPACPALAATLHLPTYHTTQQSLRGPPEAQQAAEGPGRC